MEEQERKVDSSIRIGIFGLGRGICFLKNSAAAGVEVVALCDQNEDRLRTLADEHRIAAYTDFDEFLKLLFYHLNMCQKKQEQV